MSHIVLMSLQVPLHIYSLQNRELETACEAALEGAKIIKHAWDHQPAIFKEKGGHYDLVSDVDEKSDIATQGVIRNSFPNDPILSEELNPELNQSAQGGRLWICDPLDGTACFLFRTDPQAPSVMIALTIDGTPVLSVIVQPISGNWTYAIKDRGTFKDGQRMRMRDPSKTGLNQAWVDMNHYGDKDYESAWFKRIDALVRSFTVASVFGNSYTTFTSSSRR